MIQRPAAECVPYGDEQRLEPSDAEGDPSPLRTQPIWLSAWLRLQFSTAARHDGEPRSKLAQAYGWPLSVKTRPKSGSDWNAAPLIEYWPSATKAVEPASLTVPRPTALMLTP